ALDTLITSRPPPVTTEHRATFSFVATRAIATFDCFVDNSPIVCTAGSVTVDSVAAGPHAFKVAAVSEGVIDSTPAIATWIVERPDFALVVPPSPSSSAMPIIRVKSALGAPAQVY